MKDDETPSFRDREQKLAAIAEFNNFMAQFDALYPTDDHAEEELIRRCVMAKPPCCDRRNLRRLSKRKAMCSNCKQITWFTAGTFFHGIRKFRAWLGAVLVFESGIAISPCAYGKRVGCSYALAWETFHRLRMVIDRAVLDESPTWTSEDFIEVIAKRSRETPARAQPTAEVYCMHDVEDESMKQGGAANSSIKRPITFESLPPEQQIVYSILSDEPKHIDAVIKESSMTAGAVTAALVELELLGLVKCQGGRYKRLVELVQKTEPGDASAREPGEAKSKSKSSSNPKARDTVFASDVKGLSSIIGIMDLFVARFHGLSRKYLQLYISGIWPFANRERWARGALFAACLECEPIRRVDVQRYISDDLIKVPFATYC